MIIFTFDSLDLLYYAVWLVIWLAIIATFINCCLIDFDTVCDYKPLKNKREKKYKEFIKRVNEIKKRRDSLTKPNDDVE